ncbi:MAG: Uma2 family endonuclease [Planctomycetes bacterium]|nr:Uma2 family endonuclease [Planctomycetota bacterium]
MADTVLTHEQAEAPYRGLRMTADEFLEIPDDGYNYELIDGVVAMSPSPSPIHQAVTTEIVVQIGSYLRDHPLGRVFTELDAHVGQGPTGGDLVYKPELLFVRAERLPEMREKIIGGPDLVVEVVSRGSRRMDSETKKNDYERFGVREYWLLDPQREAMTFWRLKDGKFVEVPATGETFASEAVAGFKLDLQRVRETFKPW